TDHGAALTALPMHPRLAHMLLRGQQLGVGRQACRLAAILGERDLLRGVEDADIARRLAAFDHPAGEPALDRGALQRARQLAGQWQRLIERIDVAQPVPEPDSERWAGLLLALASPGCIAQRPGEQGAYYRSSSGRAADIDKVDSLQQQPWLVIASLGGHASQRNARIFLAAALDPEWLEHYLSEMLQI